MVRTFSEGSLGGRNPSLVSLGSVTYAGHYLAECRPTDDVVDRATLVHLYLEVNRFYPKIALTEQMCSQRSMGWFVHGDQASACEVIEPDFIAVFGWVRR